MKFFILVQVRVRTEYHVLQCRPVRWLFKGSGVLAVNINHKSTVQNIGSSELELQRRLWKLIMRWKLVGRAGNVWKPQAMPDAP